MRAKGKMRWPGSAYHGSTLGPSPQDFMGCEFLTAMRTQAGQTGRVRLREQAEKGRGRQILSLGHPKWDAERFSLVSLCSDDLGI